MRPPPNIEVEIGDGGVAYMRITDNGIGMTEEDARLAILRHATSKIQQVEDLFEYCFSRLSWGGIG